MQMHPNKDTQLCMSLSARPGNFGLRFHNHLYEQLGLNFYYKAFSSQDLPGAIGGIRALGVRGCGVSMPFKEAAIALVDELDDSVQAIDSLNTIVNTDGHLKAYNTDYIAIEQLLKKHAVPQDSTFALRGSGGMAKAVASALRDGGYANGVIVARNETAGRCAGQRSRRRRIERRLCAEGRLVHLVVRIGADPFRVRRSAGADAGGGADVRQPRPERR